MCARRPTGAMPKPNHFFAVNEPSAVPWWWCAVVVIWPVLMSWGRLRGEMKQSRYYSSTTLYCKVLLQYYSVLQSVIPVLLCTTKYYSSTTLYYTVLQRTVLLCATKYYSVLQSTTPVRLCTTKYYSSTTLYYKVLLQYYSVLQSTTPVLLCTTQYYNVLLQYYTVLQSSIHDWCPSHMKRHLQCAEQQESSSNVTKYCTCHAKWLWWLIRVTYETSFTMSGATGITIHLHQILPHDWSASHMKRHLQCAEQAKSTSNLSKYCACHAKWISWLIRVTYETSFTMRGASTVSHQPHQILRLPRNL